MSYSVKVSVLFDNEFKRIAKKHKAIKADLAKLIDELEINPTKGTHLGQNVYKIRMAISGTNKGKSGGARVITCVLLVKEVVYLSEIYFKNEFDTVEANAVIKRLKDSGSI